MSKIYRSKSNPRAMINAGMIEKICGPVDWSKTGWESIPMARKAACVLLYNEHGQILGVSRKDDPNAFGLPGGKVDPGESLEEAAIRECKEETGLDVWGLEKAFERLCEGETDYDTTTFYAKYDSAQLIGSAEHETGHIKWVTWVELLRGPFGKYNRRLLDSEVNRVQVVER